jgi:hypothetical protein
LSLLPIRDNALKKIDLLQDIVQFKMRFYRCPWARYQDAKPGSLQLRPPEHHLAELKRDYQAMQTMLFGQIPSFDEIIVQIESLEKIVNAKSAHDTEI